MSGGSIHVLHPSLFINAETHTSVRANRDEEPHDEPEAKSQDGEERVEDVPRWNFVGSLKLPRCSGLYRG